MNNFAFGEFRDSLQRLPMPFAEVCGDCCTGVTGKRHT